MTKIKICGLTSPEEAAWVSQVHADFAGMVLFFPKSKRNISLSRASEIIQALHPGIQKVAVTVSPSAEQIQQIQSLPFDFIQIHGTFSQEAKSALTLPFLRAFNVDNMEEYAAYAKDPSCAGYVFDAVKPGSGKTFDWSTIPALPASDKLFLLAGGLMPENVAAAIRSVHPDGVDVSSGVEKESGRGKDPQKIQAFVQAVRASL